jgi:hypothetical protein
VVCHSTNTNVTNAKPYLTRTRVNQWDVRKTPVANVQRVKRHPEELKFQQRLSLSLRVRDSTLPITKERLPTKGNVRSQTPFEILHSSTGPR